jgi:putative membrane protein
MANMNTKDEDQKSSTSSHARDHLANERTFLSWIRTSIGIMAFGFVVEKFALFMRQITLLLGKSQSEMLPNLSNSLQGYSSIFGVFLVALGAFICLLAFIKFKKVEKQIEDDTYHPSLLLNVLLTVSVLSIGVFLVIYLTNSI